MSRSEKGTKKGKETERHKRGVVEVREGENLEG